MLKRRLHVHIAKRGKQLSKWTQNRKALNTPNMGLLFASDILVFLDTISIFLIAFKSFK